MIQNIVLIGAGNLATQLALVLVEKGIHIKQVYSHTKESAKVLANKVNASYTIELEKLFPDADLYVIAVKDSAIQEFPYYR